uniref:(northern house mosquito) hypothetical protein n=1 Tax=Culex pipiens TaxID=7175 RepID=A0A8D8H0R2_CULPI
MFKRYQTAIVPLTDMVTDIFRKQIFFLFSNNYSSVLRLWKKKTKLKAIIVFFFCVSSCVCEGRFPYWVCFVGERRGNLNPTHDCFCVLFLKDFFKSLERSTRFSLFFLSLSLSL